MAWVHSFFAAVRWFRGFWLSTKQVDPINNKPNNRTVFSLSLFTSFRQFFYFFLVLMSGAAAIVAAVIVQIISKYSGYLMRKFTIDSHCSKLFKMSTKKIFKPSKRQRDMLMPDSIVLFFFLCHTQNYTHFGIPINKYREWRMMENGKTRRKKTPATLNVCAERSTNLTKKMWLCAFYFVDPSLFVWLYLYELFDASFVYYFKLFSRGKNTLHFGSSGWLAKKNENRYKKRNKKSINEPNE